MGCNSVVWCEVWCGVRWVAKVWCGAKSGVVLGGVVWRGVAWDWMGRDEAEGQRVIVWPLVRGR